MLVENHRSIYSIASIQVSPSSPLELAYLCSTVRRSAAAISAFVSAATVPGWALLHLERARVGGGGSRKNFGRWARNLVFNPTRVFPPRNVLTALRVLTTAVGFLFRDGPARFRVRRGCVGCTRLEALLRMGDHRSCCCYRVCGTLIRSTSWDRFVAFRLN